MKGGRVIAADISTEKLDALKAEFPEADITTVAGDLTTQDAIDAVIAAAGDTIDGLANIAGINDDFSPTSETTDAVWDSVIAINLTAPFKLMRAVLPIMERAGKGSILNVSSEAGCAATPRGNAYTASKRGLIGVTKSAAFMHGPKGIRVNSVAPGGVATGIPDAPAHVRARIRPPRPVPAGDPLRRDRRTARSLDHVLAVGRRREHQRRDPRLRQRLVGAVASADVRGRRALSSPQTSGIRPR